uniref:Uncharacterized protein n=1 Tax=Anguilla anguilla TaxID=7936 RepID=A0A0E9U3R7_ANGAN
MCMIMKISSTRITHKYNYPTSPNYLVQISY